MILFEVADGTQIFVEQQGSGEPLLLIPGLGAGTWLWAPIRDELARSFRIIMPELRGSGRSDKPDSRYSIELLARDMKSILEQCDISQAHLLGVSLGGFVAQSMATRWPEMVASLTLVSTTCGGADQVGPQGDILCRMIRPRGKTKKERLEDGYMLNFSRNFRDNHPEALQQITSWRTEHPQPEFAYYRQLLAGNAFDGLRKAKKIVAPTLICAGKDDPMVPPADVHMLHKKIAHAELHLFEGKHLFFFEQADKFVRTLKTFIEEKAARPVHEVPVSVEK